MLRAFAPIVLSLAIVATVVVAPPEAHADDGGGKRSDEASAVGLGGFAVSDGVEAMIGEADGSLSFALPLGPVTLVWGSGSPAEDRYGLGERWRLDTAIVDARGGVRVAPASGGVFDADAAVPSGLSGYATADVRFERAAPGAVPARDGAGEVAAAWSLFELGGAVTHFAASGEPVARLDATGRRTDWVWDPDRPHRLTRIVDPDGIVTELAWRRSSVAVTVGANLAASVAWRVEFGEHGPTRVVDPVGQVSEVGYAGGLVATIAGPSGATAKLTWHASDDGVARVARVAVLAVDGTELSARTWREVGATAPSGWPASGGGARVPGAIAGPTQTEQSDGGLRVRAEYDGLGRLVARLVSVVTALGEREFQRQAFEYRHAASRVPTAGAGSTAWSKPITSTLTHVDASGGMRTVKESFEFDDLGRLATVTDAAGLVTVYEYDQHGTLAAAAQHQDGADGRVVAAVRYHYDAYGRVDRLERGNGVTTAYTFTSAGQIASETTTSHDTTTAVREYEYDRYGALIRRVDRTRDHRNISLCEQTTDYRYDALDRLQGSTLTVKACTDGETDTVRATEYGVTAAGDLAGLTTEERSPSGVLERSVRSFEYSPAGELLAIEDDGVRTAQVFDGTGHLIEGAKGTLYVYDAAGRIIEQTAPKGASTRTTYWADGTRRSLVTEDAETRFYWDAGRLLNDRHTIGEDTTTASYLLGASRHARTLTTGGTGGTGDTGHQGVVYYGTDRHGSITDLTDAAGDTVATYRYGDYGEPLGGESVPGMVVDAARNPFGYAGEYTDPDGSQPLGDRVYDAGLARFRTPDRAPQFNRFAYANLNPITNVDPTGRTAQVDAGHWALLGVGIAVAVAVAVFEIVTAGTTAAMIAAVVAGAVDAGLQLLDGINEKAEFMPGQLGVVIGVAAIAATIGLSMYMKRTTLLPKSKRQAEAAVESASHPEPGSAPPERSVFVPAPPSAAKIAGDPREGYVVFASVESELTRLRRLPYRERVSQAHEAFPRMWDQVVEERDAIVKHAILLDVRGVISEGLFDRTVAFLTDSFGEATAFRRFVLAQSSTSRAGLWAFLESKTNDEASARIFRHVYGDGWGRIDLLRLYQPVFHQIGLMKDLLSKQPLQESVASVLLAEWSAKLKPFVRFDWLISDDVAFLSHMPANFARTW